MSTSARRLLLLVLGLLCAAEVGSAARYEGPHGYERHRKTYPDPDADWSQRERTGRDSQPGAEYQDARGYEKREPSEYNAERGYEEREEPSEYKAVRGYEEREPSEYKAVRGYEAREPSEYKAVRGYEAREPSEYVADRGYESREPSEYVAVRGYEAREPSEYKVERDYEEREPREHSYWSRYLSYRNWKKAIDEEKRWLFGKTTSTTRSTTRTTTTTRPTTTTTKRTTTTQKPTTTTTRPTTTTRKPTTTTITTRPTTRTTTKTTTMTTWPWFTSRSTSRTSTNSGHEGPRDCHQVRVLNPRADSGVYTIWAAGYGPVSVYCNMPSAGGGWTVIQKRIRGDQSTSFYRGWTDYAQGFGDRSVSYWLGNAALHGMTSSSVAYVLRIELVETSGLRRYAEYSNFLVANSATYYKLLSLGSYSGTAGDALTSHVGAPFSTYDQDNDSAPDGSCAQTYLGGWWYTSCGSANLNGVQVHGDPMDGVFWPSSANSGPSQFQLVEMLIRPQTF